VIIAAARSVVLALLLALLPGCSERGGEREVVRFWALGREGEVVTQLIPEFERLNPGIRVKVQQIPFTVAHEKLLTAFAGGVTPDVAQLGTSWVAELVALGALEPLDAPIAASLTVEQADYFPGGWTNNVIGGSTWGVPWYADTRLLFYRRDLLREAGPSGSPRCARSRPVPLPATMPSSFR